MRATGIVRRIDDLGRVVIPKEIRRTMRIREGEPMEIFTGREGEIILKKYSPIGELGAFAREYAPVPLPRSADTWSAFPTMTRSLPRPVRISGNIWEKPSAGNWSRRL